MTVTRILKPDELIQTHDRVRLVLDDKCRLNGTMDIDNTFYPLVGVANDGQTLQGGYGNPIRIGGSDDLSGVTWDSNGKVIGFTVNGTTYSIDWTAGVIQNSDGGRWLFVRDTLGRFASFTAD